MSIVRNFLFRRNDLAAVFSSKHFSKISTPCIRCSSPFQQIRSSSISISEDKSSSVKHDTDISYSRSYTWAKHSISRSVDKRGYVTANFLNKIIADLKKQQHITSNHAVIILRALNYLVFSDSMEKKGILDNLSFKNVENFENDTVKAQYFNYLMRNYNEHAQGINSVEMLEEMKLANITPDKITFQNLIYSHCKNKELDEALHIAKYMESKDMMLSSYSYNHISYCNALLGKNEEALDCFVQHCLKDRNANIGFLCLGFAQSGNMEMLKETLNRFGKKTPIYESFSAGILAEIVKQGNEKSLSEIAEFFPVIENTNVILNLCEQLNFKRRHMDVIYPHFRLQTIYDNHLIKLIAQKICIENNSFDDVNSVAGLFEKHVHDAARFNYTILQQLVLTENFECAKGMMLHIYKDNIEIKGHMKKLVSDKLLQDNSDLDGLARFLVGLFENNENKNLQSVGDFFGDLLTEKFYLISHPMFLKNFILLSKSLHDCGYIHTDAIRPETISKIVVNILKNHTNLRPHALYRYFMDKSKQSYQKLLQTISIMENASQACATVGIAFNQDAIFSELLFNAQHRLSTEDYNTVLERVLEIPNLVLSDSCINNNIWNYILTGNSEKLNELAIPTHLPTTYDVSFIPKHILNSGHPDTLSMLEDYLKRSYGEADTYWILFSSFLQNDMMKEFADLNDRYKYADKQCDKWQDYVSQCIAGLSENGTLSEKFPVLWNECKDEQDSFSIFSQMVTKISDNADSLLQILKSVSVEKHVFSINRILDVLLEHNVMPPESLGLSEEVRELIEIVMQDDLDVARFSDVLMDVENKRFIPYSILTRFYCRVIGNKEFGSDVVSRVTRDMAGIYLPYRQTTVLSKKIDMLLEENKVKEAVQFIGDNFQTPSRERNNINIWYSALHKICEAATKNDLVDCVFDLAEIVDGTFNGQFFNLKDYVDAHLIYLQYKLYKTLPKFKSVNMLRCFIAAVRDYQGKEEVLGLKQTMMEQGLLNWFMLVLLSEQENHSLALKIINEENLDMANYVEAYQHTHSWDDLLSLDKLFQKKSKLKSGTLKMRFLRQLIYILPNSPVTADFLYKHYFSSLSVNTYDSIIYPIIIHHLQFNSGNRAKYELKSAMLQKLKNKRE